MIDKKSGQNGGFMWISSKYVQNMDPIILRKCGGGLISGPLKNMRFCKCGGLMREDGLITEHLRFYKVWSTVSDFLPTSFS